jgi:hypothetical protein
MDRADISTLYGAGGGLLASLVVMSGKPHKKLNIYDTGAVISRMGPTLVFMAGGVVGGYLGSFFFPTLDPMWTGLLMGTVSSAVAFRYVTGDGIELDHFFYSH